MNELADKTFRGYVFQYSKTGDPMVKIFTPEIHGKIVFINRYLRKPELGREVEYQITQEYPNFLLARLVRILTE